MTPEEIRRSSDEDLFARYEELGSLIFDLTQEQMRVSNERNDRRLGITKQEVSTLDAFKTVACAVATSHNESGLIEDEHLRSVRREYLRCDDKSGARKYIVDKLKEHLVRSEDINLAIAWNCIQEAVHGSGRRSR